MYNGTLLQCFEWYLPDDASFWRKVARLSPELLKLGFTCVWLPPAYKGADGIKDVGYAVYDTYDLGEFDQKGSVPTKYGTKEEYLAAIDALHQNGISVLADLVLNHRIGADGDETVMAHKDAETDRRVRLGKSQPIRAFTLFTFPGRGGKYSDFTWNFRHFSGVDWDQAKKEKGIYQFEGKTWDVQVDHENGNFDYLMGANVDVNCDMVVRQLDLWGAWYLATCGVDGFRVDAVKHIRFDFFTHFLDKLRRESGKELFSVGEYWKADVGALLSYLSISGGCMSLFDVPLHFRFYDAARLGASFDLRGLLADTLVNVQPTKAVTFVDNHDTQPGQALESYVSAWFKPLAYAVILLREGGYPCVFYGDLYGIPHDHIPSHYKMLSLMMKARNFQSYGSQHDFFDDANLVGWTREGDDVHAESGLSVVLSNAGGGTKRMFCGVRSALHTFSPVWGGGNDVQIDENGWGDFYAGPGQAAVYLPKEAKSHFHL